LEVFSDRDRESRPNKIIGSAHESIEKREMLGVSIARGIPFQTQVVH
jgi:hypothetical protein